MCSYSHAYCFPNVWANSVKKAVLSKILVPFHGDNLTTVLELCTRKKSIISNDIILVQLLYNIFIQGGQIDNILLDRNK